MASINAAMVSSEKGLKGRDSAVQFYYLYIIVPAAPEGFHEGPRPCGLGNLLQDRVVMSDGLTTGIEDIGVIALSDFLREKRFKTRSVTGTLAMGERVAEVLLPAPKLIVLRGDLGAGKTTLVKGIAAALGAASEEDVTSPTFTLVHEYAGPKVRLYHLDLYRLETERELLTLGLDEMAEQPDALVLVEWGEKFPSVMERADGEIAIERLEGDERAFLIRVGR
jgi:tRNA threonylcarbamoyladenosine biosynthesis protein TsaE